MTKIMECSVAVDVRESKVGPQGLVL